MAVNRAQIVDENFMQFANNLPHNPTKQLRESERLAGLYDWEMVDIFHSMVTSRHLDIQARELKNTHRSFYTIGSSGHEGNACVAKALRHTDPAFLHYRSGGFYIQRSKQVDGVSGAFDVLKGIVASTQEPIAGGRHKVFGSVPLHIPPQTSTIASHLPKAVGAAFTINRQKRLGLSSDIPSDSIVVCTFGDASSNHASACTAFNAAALSSHQNLPCPVLFVCEDNGIGISVRTPHQWVQTRFENFAGIEYFAADGLDILDCYAQAQKAVEYVRTHRRPAFLHVKLVRLLGHAGSDVEQLYRSTEEIEKLERLDPLLQTAQTLHSLGILSGEEILQIYENARVEIRALAHEAASHAQIDTAEKVISVLAPYDREKIQTEAQTPPDLEKRLAFHGRLPEEDRPRHLAMLINRGLGDLMCKYPEMMLFGEDVAQKGGVYHVTADLYKKAGLGRVFNTELDETSILGLAIGAGHLGMLPVPEIQYLAYLHNAIDQLRGEACSLQFFSQGQFRNPMVVRIAGYAYQKGFGGHFHNDNSIAAIRDIPGIIMASPSNGEDAVLMLRTCMAVAKLHGLVAVFLEPIALYMTKDLHEAKDDLWSATYPTYDKHVPIGSGKLCREGKDICIISYANGLWMSLRVAEKLAKEGIECAVYDLRWLQPLPESEIIQLAMQYKKVLVVDECRKTGGMAEPILALIAEHTEGVRAKRVAGLDTYIPLGDAANLVLVQEDDIEKAITQLCAQ